MTKMDWERARELAKGGRGNGLNPPTRLGISRDDQAYASLAGLPLFWKVQEGEAGAYREAIRRWQLGSRSSRVAACIELMRQRGVPVDTPAVDEPEPIPAPARRTPHPDYQALRAQLRLAPEDAPVEERLQAVTKAAEALVAAAARQTVVLQALTAKSGDSRPPSHELHVPPAGRRRE